MNGCVSRIDRRRVHDTPLHDLAGDKLVILTEKGEALLCDAAPGAFVDRGRFQALGGRCWAPPAIAEGKLFVRNNSGRLVCYGLR